MAGGQCSAVFFEGGVHSRLARNFDFYGPRVWGRHRAIKVSIPPSGQPWLWAGPLGIPVGGFGVNASGIAVMPFTNFTRDLSLRGLPLFTLMQTILEESHSLDDALAYLERARRHGGISLLVADMQRGETAAIAVGARRLLVDRPRDGVLVRTNHHHELDRPPQPGMSMWQRHSRSRWQRLDRLARDLPPGATEPPVRGNPGDRTLPDDGARCWRMSLALSGHFDPGRDGPFVRMPVSGLRRYAGTGFRWTNVFRAVVETRTLTSQKSGDCADGGGLVDL